MTAATKLMTVEQPTAHLRVVSEQPAANKASGIHLAGVSKTYGRGDGKVQSL
eukprot:gene37558-50702_t